MILSTAALAIPGNKGAHANQNASFQSDDGRIGFMDGGTLSIKVDIEDGKTEVKVLQPGSERGFELDTMVDGEIVAQIAFRTGLTEAQVRDNMNVKTKEDNQNDDNGGKESGNGKKSHATIDIVIDGKQRTLRGFIADPFKNRVRMESDTNQGGILDQNFDLNSFRKGIIVKVSDGNKIVEITIRKGNGQTITLDQNDFSASANGGVEFDGNALYIAKFNGKHAFKVLPEQASEIAKRHAGFFAIKLLQLDVDDQNNAVYIARGLNIGKFFGIIPVQFESETHINAKTGIVMSSKKPWWAVLVTQNK